MDTGEQLAARAQTPRAEGSWEGRLCSPSRSTAKNSGKGAPDVPIGFRNQNTTGKWVEMTTFYLIPERSILSSLLFPELVFVEGRGVEPQK